MIAVATQVVGAQRVDGDKKDIGPGPAPLLDVTALLSLPNRDAPDHAGPGLGLGGRYNQRRTLAL